MKTCENCGSRVYKLGCTYCNEDAYIQEQMNKTEAEEYERELELEALREDYQAALLQEYAAQMAEARSAYEQTLREEYAAEMEEDK